MCIPPVCFFASDPAVLAFIHRLERLWQEKSPTEATKDFLYHPDLDGKSLRIIPSHTES